MTRERILVIGGAEAARQALQVAQAIAEAGHGDMLVVSDPGEIARDVERTMSKMIDRAEGVPEQVLFMTGRGKPSIGRDRTRALAMAAAIVAAGAPMREPDEKWLADRQAPRSFRKTRR